MMMMMIDDALTSCLNNKQFIKNNKIYMRNLI